MCSHVVRSIPVVTARGRSGTALVHARIRGPSQTHDATKPLSLKKPQPGPSMSSRTGALRRECRQSFADSNARAGVVGVDGGLVLRRGAFASSGVGGREVSPARDRLGRGHNLSAKHNRLHATMSFGKSELAEHTRRRLSPDRIERLFQTALTGWSAPSRRWPTERDHASPLSNKRQHRVIADVTSVVGVFHRETPRNRRELPISSRQLSIRPSNRCARRSVRFEPRVAVRMPRCCEMRITSLETRLLCTIELYCPHRQPRGLFATLANHPQGH